LARRPRPCLSRGSSFRKCYMPATARFIGFTARPPPSLFPAPASAVMTDRPLVLYAPASSFQTVRPPQSSFTVISRSRSENRKHYLPGFWPYLRRHWERPLTTRLPIPRYVPPIGFLNLPAVSSAPQLLGLISSRSHIQGSPVQGFFPSQGLTFLSEGSSSSPLARSSSPPEGDGRLHARRPRGFHPCEDPSPPVECYPLRRPLPSSGSSSSRFSAFPL
jgi:hypothetical protein